MPSVFLARTMAFLIDTALLGCVHISAFLIIGRFLFQETLNVPPAFSGVFLSYSLFFLMSPPLMSLFYFTVLHAFGGQTPGKGIMGLQVVSVSNKPLTIETSFLRWVGYLVSMLPLGAGFFWAAFDKEQSAWHDKLARTRVIRKRNIS